MFQIDIFSSKTNKVATMKRGKRNFSSFSKYYKNEKKIFKMFCAFLTSLTHKLSIKHFCILKTNRDTN